jgi:hypothetical protein
MERLMRTELARVQTEAQKQSFERNGFTQYTFHTNHGCCSVCSAIDGKHFDVEKMMPGENAPPMHPNCRCSTSAYEDSDEYEAWLDYLEQGGTTEEWNTTGKSNWEKSQKTLENSGKPLYSLFKKLSNAVGATPEITKTMKDAASKMPTRHRELVESVLSGVEVTDSEVGSYFKKSTKQLYIARKADERMVLHEFAHVLEYALDSYNNDDFRKIMFKGLENIKPSDIIEDETTFVIPIYRIENEKFIEPYQGRLYEEYGIFSGGKVSLEGMRDYLAPSYAEYILNPDNLKKHDPELWEYFEGIT